MDVIIGWVRAIDRTAFSFINKQLKSRVLDNIMPKITHLGGAISTISTIVLLLLFARGTIRNFAIDAAISLSLSHIIVLIIKKYIIGNDLI